MSKWHVRARGDRGWAGGGGGGWRWGEGCQKAPKPTTGLSSMISKLPQTRISSTCVSTDPVMRSHLEVYYMPLHSTYVCLFSKTMQSILYMHITEAVTNTGRETQDNVRSPFTISSFGFSKQTKKQQQKKNNKKKNKKTLKQTKTFISLKQLQITN